MLLDDWVSWAVIAALVGLVSLSLPSCVYGSGSSLLIEDAPDHSFCRCLQSIVVCWVLQWVLQWFTALNVASAQQSTERFLEDPTSLQKVQHISLLCMPNATSPFAFNGLTAATASGGFSVLWCAPLHLCAAHDAHRTICMQVPAPSLFSEATKSLSVVVPAFNEEQRIAPMLDETLG